MSSIKQQFLQYFKSHNHLIIPSYPVIPQNDPSLLLINSGMAPMKKFFTGITNPPNNRIANCQKCIRAGGKHNDLDDVGYTKRHHTFFEMLGNFSFGDYFREEAITMAWNFLTKTLNLPKKQLYITIHPSDIESEKIWLSMQSKSNIVYEQTNQWSAGTEGPCGVCTEIFYDYGDSFEGDFHHGDRFVEIWNIVLMTHTVECGIKKLLEKPCVDAGMGLERLEALYHGTNDNYKAPFFQNMINTIKENDTNDTNNRIVADHSRAISFMIDDGVTPDADGVGYVLRKIIRRAIRRSINNNSLELCVNYIVDNMKHDYPTLLKNKDIILNIVKEEKEQFLNVYNYGIEQLNYLITNKKVNESKIFELYDTHGFPHDIAFEILREKKIKYDINCFNKFLDEQKSVSKLKKYHINASKQESIFVGYNEEITNCSIISCKNTNNINKPIIENEEGFILLDKTPFYVEAGGQKNDIGIITTNSGKFEVKDLQKENKEIWHVGKCIKGTINSNEKATAEINSDRRKSLKQHHSSTHILLAILRKKFGDSIKQKGSSVKENSLRLDFSSQNLISQNELNEITYEINKIIQSNLEVTTTIMNYEKAVENGALLTEKNYPSEVRVLKIGDISTELCCGTHVNHTGEIGLLIITSHKSIASGVKRIEAVCGQSAIKHILNPKESKTKESKINIEKPIKIYSKDINNSNFKVLLNQYNNSDNKYMLTQSDIHISNYDITILINTNNEKHSVLIRVKDSMIEKIGTAKDILLKLGGTGGGKSNIAQGNIKQFNINEIISKVEKI